MMDCQRLPLQKYHIIHCQKEFTAKAAVKIYVTYLDFFQASAIRTYTLQMSPKS
jgi:hypothetical protein